MHSQMNMVINDANVINTVLTGDRSAMEVSNFDSLKNYPISTNIVDDNTYSDMPSFYHLYKFNNRYKNELGENKKICDVNKF